MTDTAPSIQREESGTRGAFHADGPGGRLGTLTYSRTTPTLVILDSTDVSEAARGTGLGRRLVEAAVVWARDTQTKIIPLCPYAKSVFERDAALRDVLQG